ncbi:MAG: hypothetical protein AB7O78_03825 [Thermoleophilia bacterium]
MFSDDGRTDMATLLTIRCTCGHLVAGEDEAQLLAAAREHIASRHPDLVGRVSDADLLALRVDR